MNSYENLLQRGISAAERGQYNEALIVFKQAVKHGESPTLKCYRAYCHARNGGRLVSAAYTCQEAIEQETHNSTHYLLLGRILLLGGKRWKAIQTFKRGLKFSSNPLIMNELNRLGRRRPPVIGALDRDHPLNRVLGKTSARFGLR